MDKQELQSKVRQKYARAIAARTGSSTSGCCSSAGCCGSDNQQATDMITGTLYAFDDLAGLPEDLLKLSLGCGNPTAMGNLYPGETVLDLGSGAGLDVLLSARRVGAYGKAYGLDMTDEMLVEANANKVRAGVANAEFLKGTIESIPLPDGCVDVVISNCVINLSVDKDRVFREIFRVLRPGGRIAVSDIVLTRPLPESIRMSLLAWAGCMAGALTDEEYRGKLTAAGFQQIELEVTRVYDMTGSSGQKWLPEATPELRESINGSLVSAFVRAKKPARLLQSGVDFSIRPAIATDFPAIQALLAANGLPTDGVDPATGSYWVAEQKEILGVVGCEKYGDSALLRSLAVSGRYRKSGIAGALVDQVLAELKAERITAAYLLTETAADFFRRRGFMIIQRESIPADILASSALGQICPASSKCLELAF